MLERIQKIMAHAGVASRRKCEELIEKGAVKVNGKSIKLGDKADYKKDKITVNGKLIKKEQKVYIIINKPKNILCSVDDRFGRKTVIDLVDTKEKIFPVGRLDYNSEGLMILTNDGDFANRIIHPRYNVKKTYFVTLDKPLSKKDEDKILDGVEIYGKKVGVLELEVQGRKVILSIHEGRKHIIRNTFGVLGYNVIRLERIAIGNLTTNLESGDSKFVSKEWLKKNIFEAIKPKDI